MCLTTSSRRSLVGVESRVKNLLFFFSEAKEEVKEVDVVMQNI